MLADAVYDALHPFHLWAQVAAVCALLLAVAAVAVLALSPRLTHRWWLGMGILAACLLTVAFGERSRAAAGDLRPIAICYVRWDSGCETWTPWIAEATRRAASLGSLAVVTCALGLAAALATAFAERQTIASWVRHPSAQTRALPLLLPLCVAGLGAYLTAGGVAGWGAYAYLSDITRAGDGIGQIPLFSAIASTVFGVLILAVGLALVMACSPPRRAGVIRSPGGDQIRA